MDSRGDNWAETVRDVERGDQRAFLKLSSFVVSRLRFMRATDFRDDWSDLVQEVIVDVVMRLRKDGASDASRIRGLIITVTHRRYMDRLRAYYQRREGKTFAWEDAVEGLISREGAPAPHLRQTLRECLERLNPEQSVALQAVYGAGYTYQEAASQMGLPLGTLKRYLRLGLTALRRCLGIEPRDQDEDSEEER